MSRRLNRSTHHDDEGVNMTPMLDIVFILLIFFIVTAVFLDEDGIDFTQLRGESPITTPIAVISIVIDASDKVSVEGRVVPLTLVEAEVQRHLANRPDAVIDLRAAETARLKNVVQVKDDMEFAGLKVIFETYPSTQLAAKLE